MSICLGWPARPKPTPPGLSDLIEPTLSLESYDEAELLYSRPCCADYSLEAE